MYYKEKTGTGRLVKRLLQGSSKVNRTSDELHGEGTELHLNSKDYSFPKSLFISTQMGEN